MQLLAKFATKAGSVLQDLLTNRGVLKTFTALWHQAPLCLVHQAPMAQHRVFILPRNVATALLGTIVQVEWIRFPAPLALLTRTWADQPSSPVLHAPLATHVLKPA